MLDVFSELQKLILRRSSVVLLIRFERHLSICSTIQFSVGAEYLIASPAMMSIQRAFITGLSTCEIFVVRLMRAMCDIFVLNV